MKKYIKNLSSNIKVNKNLFVFLIVLVFVGVMSGAILSSILNKNDSKLVSDYLNNFLTSVNNNKIDYSSSFVNTSVFSLGTSLLIWIFGVSIIGTLLILPIIFIKSFILGFSIGSIIINFKFKGVFLSLIYIIPHNVINILIYILVSGYAIILSFKLLNSMKNKKVFDFKKIMNRYTYVLVFSLIILFLTSLYEVFILPKLICFVSNLIK